jgi:cyclopropane-fatty-acyl-phospholipid synthase
VSAVRIEPAARGRALEGIAVSILERALARLQGGTLEVVLPDGRSRRFGSGAPVRLEIRDRAFFRRLATRGKLGLGESYTAEEWESDDLVALFELLLRNADTVSEHHSKVRRLLELRPRLNRRNGLVRARSNIAYHYDLGNDLFALMLDETMTYSCAVFEHPDMTLAEAQRAKYERLCTMLELEQGDHVLEIGCGWGGFAHYAASKYGCRVTGLTISHEQAVVARERNAGLPVEIREQDYRTVDGQYTKVVSIEMLEAIGEDQFGDYFATIDRVLAPGGRAAIQAILVPEERWERYRSTPDWIERYVFPGCLIPSLESLARAAAKHSRLSIYGVDEIGEHYAETLRQWRANFNARIEDVRALGYEGRFERTWDFYLAFCEAGFRTRALRDAHLLIGRAGSIG